MKRLRICLLFLVVTGCSTSPIKPSDAKPVAPDRILGFQQATADAARIVVTRDSGALGMGCSYRLTINGTPAAVFWPAETASFNVAAGPLVLKLLSEDLACSGDVTRETNITVGEVKPFRIKAGSDGSLDIQRAE
jgi:hypothetical protein